MSDFCFFIFLLKAQIFSFRIFVEFMRHLVAEKLNEVITIKFLYFRWYRINNFCFNLVWMGFTCKNQRRDIWRIIWITTGWKKFSQHFPQVHGIDLKPRRIFSAKNAREKSWKIFDFVLENWGTFFHFNYWIYERRNINYK